MSKKTLKEKMADKQEELKRKNSGNIFFQKADTTTRVRILNMGEEEEFIKEIVQFYLGNDIKGVISPQTFGEPCGINEGYEELKTSKESSDKELASKFSPKKKYLAWVAICKDGKGKDWEEEPKFVLLSAGQYGEILDLFLDDDDWGDMTNPLEGYDIKLKRIGSGKTDTKYSVSPCSKSKSPKAFRKEIYDLDEQVQAIMPSYEETKNLLETYLGLEHDDDEDEPKKKKKKKGKKGKKNRDIED